MKATTMAGLMAGSALGIAVGAGLMMMPQAKQVRRRIEKSAGDIGKSVAQWIK